MALFLNALQAETNLTRTENGAVTNQSSLDPIVDFFSLAGALRHHPEGAADLFEAAYNTEPQTAVRVLFYLRDIRGGQGERDVFRAGMKRLLALDKAAYLSVAQFVPEYGRWDDLFHPFYSQAIDLIDRQLYQDLVAADDGQSVSLLAKWMPSENTSSRETCELATRVRNSLGMNSRDYRQTLSKLRQRIRLLEHDMSANHWEKIDYSTLPSQAHRRHTKAFRRHSPDRYQAYLDSVERGEKKINVSTVYPYEIYKMVNDGQEQYANVAWENLPDYTTDEDALVMADVSGSMYQGYKSNNPIAVSVSMALYFAERNKGAYKGYYLSFSAEPRLIKVTGSTLSRRMAAIQRNDVGYNTDLSKAFRAILAAGVKTGELPKVLYIISDMEFDAATRPWGSRTSGADQTVFNTARREFSEAGLILPHVVFWNVDARNMQAPALAFDGAVSLVSGCSPTVFGMAVQGKNPRQLVDDVVNGPRYERIVL